MHNEAGAGLSAILDDCVRVFVLSVSVDMYYSLGHCFQRMCWLSSINFKSLTHIEEMFIPIY